MKSKVLYILLFAIVIGNAANAQLNSYKYIIVPKKFEAFKSVNEYQTSTLVKYFFEENGFQKKVSTMWKVQFVKMLQSKRLM